MAGCCQLDILEQQSRAAGVFAGGPKRILSETSEAKYRQHESAGLARQFGRHLAEDPSEGELVDRSH